MPDSAEDDPIGEFIDALDELGSGNLATIFNGIFDLHGVQHPAHATAAADLKPAVHVLTSTTIHGGLLLLGSALVPELEAAEGVQTLSSSNILFSQSSVSGVEEIAASMRLQGWIANPHR